MVKLLPLLHHLVGADSGVGLNNADPVTVFPNGTVMIEAISATENRSFALFIAVGLI